MVNPLTDEGPDSPSSGSGSAKAVPPSLKRVMSDKDKEGCSANKSNKEGRFKKKKTPDI